MTGSNHTISIVNLVDEMQGDQKSDLSLFDSRFQVSVFSWNDISIWLSFVDRRQSASLRAALACVRIRLQTDRLTWK
ncbi:hypothetical protein OAF34_04495 [Pirellulaceae bacterium]|jgi:hypothetical protein|nr:hypothetical protein [Pirellulaceae bacterium]